MRVAVVQGGPSTEAEVSRRSAQAVAKALGESGHVAQTLELCPDLPKTLQAFAPDVVFPAVHGTQGEDGCVQGLLEVLGYSYVGSDVRASALSADKISAKLFFRAAGLLVARDRTLPRAAWDGETTALLCELRLSLGDNLIVKPAQGGSTIGITRVLSGSGPEALDEALRAALACDGAALIEEYIPGQEVTCAVLEDERGARALPPTLIISSATEWYDFESKYAPGGSRHLCPAPFSESLTRTIQDAAVRAHRAVGARDLSRSDFIVSKSEEAFLLEINTLPGMTDVSLFPEAARADGLSFAQLVHHLVTRAEQRGSSPLLSGRPLPGP